MCFCIFGFVMITAASFAQIKSVDATPTLTIQNFQNWWAAGSNLEYQVHWVTQNLGQDYEQVFIQFTSVDGKYTLAQGIKNNGKFVLKPIRRRVYDLEGRVLVDGGYTLVVCAYKGKDFNNRVCDTRSFVEINYEY